MNTMKCDEIRCLLEDDARDTREDAAVRDHLAGCSACAAYATSLDAQNAAVKRSLSFKPDELRFERLKRAAAQRIQQDVRPPAQRWRIVAIAAGIAAMLAVAVGIYSMNTGKPDSPMAGQTLGTTGNVLNQVAELQTKIRATQVLDELVQLQAAMDAPEDQDGKSTAEDAELYIERILALHGSDELAYRETLLGIDRSGVSGRLKKLRDSFAADAPKPVLASLDLAIATFDQAGQIVQSKEVAYAD